MRRGTYLMRLRDERVKDMKAEQWERKVVKGIAPYTIDRVLGTYLVEFHPQTGRSLTFGEQYRVVVTAFDLRHPDGKSERFALLKDAKARVQELKGGA